MNTQEDPGQGDQHVSRPCQNKTHGSIWEIKGQCSQSIRKEFRGRVTRIRASLGGRGHAVSLRPLITIWDITNLTLWILTYI